MIAVLTNKGDLQLTVNNYTILGIFRFDEFKKSEYYLEKLMTGAGSMETMGWSYINMSSSSKKPSEIVCVDTEYKEWRTKETIRDGNIHQNLMDSLKPQLRNVKIKNILGS